MSDLKDRKDERKRSRPAPTLSISSAPARIQEKEKKIPAPEPMDLSETKETKGLGTISLSQPNCVGLLYPESCLTPRYRTRSRSSWTNPHYAPMPRRSLNPIFLGDHAINEWVLNHLPISERNKKKH